MQGAALTPSAHLLPPPAGKGGAMSSYKFSSVGSRFKKQLGDLMVALHTMEPHYIRCIKPNSFNRPMDFENMNVLHQVSVEGSVVVRKPAGPPWLVLGVETGGPAWLG